MRPAIEVEDLRYSYPDGREALRGVSLSIVRGEKVSLVGPNGAGKSTLLLHLNGLLKGDGHVRILGTPLSGGDLRRVRARVGLVFQNPDDQLFSSTVFEDVAYGPIYMGLPAEEVRRRVDQALSQVGLDGFERRVPYHLSIGEKRRVTVATVLAMEPDILALDEPSSGLDPRGRHDLIRLLGALPQTLLIATHDMLLVRELLPRTIIMDQGRVVADGATEELLGDRELLVRHGLAAPESSERFVGHSIRSAEDLGFPRKG